MLQSGGTDADIFLRHLQVEDANLQATRHGFKPKCEEGLRFENSEGCKFKEAFTIVVTRYSEKKTKQQTCTVQSLSRQMKLKTRPTIQRCQGSSGLRDRAIGWGNKGLHGVNSCRTLRHPSLKPCSYLIFAHRFP